MDSGKAGGNSFFSRDGCNFGISLPSFVSKFETLTLWGCFPVAQYYDVLAGGSITLQDRAIELWECREDVVRAEKTLLLEVWMCSSAVVYYGKRRPNGAPSLRMLGSPVNSQYGKWIFSSDIPLTVYGKKTGALLLKVIFLESPLADFGND